MEHRPVDPILMLRNIFDQQLGTGEVRLDRRPQQFGEDREVERQRPPARPDARVERGWVAMDQPVERTVDCFFPALASNVLHHWAVRYVQPRLVEGGEEEA